MILDRKGPAMATKKELNQAKKEISKEELTRVVRQNDFLLMRFDSFDIAKQWIEDHKELFRENGTMIDKNKGLDYRWTPQYSKFDMLTFLVEMGEDTTNYTLTKLQSIIAKRRAEELKNVHYVWFQLIKNDLSLEESYFIADHVESWQISSFSKNFIKKIDVRAIERIVKNTSQISDYWTLYKMLPQTPSKIFALVKTENLSDVYARQVKYLKKKKTTKLDSEVSLNPASAGSKKNGINSIELIKYLDLPSTSFYSYRKQEEDALYKLVEQESKERATCFTQKSVLEYLNSIYENQNPEQKNSVKYYAPKGRLYTWQNLMSRYGAKKITSLTIQRAIEKGILPCFRIKERIMRFSEQDFENFLDYREEHYKNTNTASRNYVTFKDEKDLKKAMDNSFSDAELKRILPASRSNHTEFVGSHVYADILSNLPKFYFVKKATGDEPEDATKDGYGNILEKRYYKKDVEKLFNKHYGYLKEDRDGVPIIKPVKIKITKDIEFIYPSTFIYEKYGHNIPRLNIKREYIVINDRIKNGEIPAFFFTSSNRLILREHAERIAKEVND